ncbi:MAG: PAS domain-containing protein, partial [Pseudomonadota bacterium]|nr:PAS domain-containing protein [Pseudomonadota bacterium]
MDPNEPDDAIRNALGLNSLILDSSRDCIVILDLEGHTQFVSRGGVEAMEIDDVRAIIGLSWLRVWEGEDHRAAVAALAEARAGRTARFQAYCPTHKGTPKWWDMAISPLPGADGRPERLASIGRDITDMKRAAQRLAASEAQFRTFAQAMPNHVWT